MKSTTDDKPTTMGDGQHGERTDEEHHPPPSSQATAHGVDHGWTTNQQQQGMSKFFSFFSRSILFFTNKYFLGTNLNYWQWHNGRARGNKTTRGHNRMRQSGGKSPKHPPPLLWAPAHIVDHGCSTMTQGSRRTTMRGTDSGDGNDEETMWWDDCRTRRGDDTTIMDNNTSPRRHLSPGCFLSFLWPRGHVSPVSFFLFFLLHFSGPTFHPMPMSACS